MNYPAYVQSVPVLSQKGKQYYVIIERKGQKEFPEEYKKLLTSYPLTKQVQTDGTTLYLFEKK